MPNILEASEFRFAQDDPLEGLGLLSPLAGKWHGTGMNLIARPAFHFKALNGGVQPNLFLQINFTKETLEFRPIGSPIPNRGFLQDDVTLRGLTYLQQISDAANPGIGAMHIEPGIWVHEDPKELTPDDAPPPGGEVVTRMASIPHGNAILAQGTALPFTGAPVLPLGHVIYNGSLFPSFNSSPFAAPPIVPTPTFHAAASSVAGLNAANPLIPNFPQYTLATALSNADPGSRPAGLTQAEIDDPIVVLQNEVNKNIADGFTFKGGTAINICTASAVQFEATKNLVTGTPVVVNINQFNGGVQNTVFLADRQPTPPPSGNALTQTVYATFWIEHLTHRDGYDLLQLQYAQMVVLNFPLSGPLPPPPAPQVAANIGWPHITVGTLRKHFG